MGGGGGFVTVANKIKHADYSQIEHPVNGRVDGADPEQAEDEAQRPHRALEVPRVIGVGAGDPVPQTQHESPNLQHCFFFIFRAGFA